MTDISNNANFIDSRDVIERINELETDIEDLTTDNIAANEEQNELDILLALQDECNYGDWEHGETLINDDYFTEYTQQLANDIYGIEDHWPYTCIDWDSAAEQLQQDYACVDFDGVEFWIRA